MRVIAGAAKGRRLRAPAGTRTRPIMDRVKEALFSSIASEIPDARVLDLYAGSGALGIEALSRGASAVTFVERDRRALKALVDNLTAVELEGQVIFDDVRAYLAACDDTYSVVFIDPPYGLSLALVSEVLEGAAARLANGGLMIVHRRAGEPAPAVPSGTSRSGDRRYGDTQLWIYRKDES